MQNTVKVAVKKPGCGIEVIECADNLKTWQDIVGGWLEAVPFGSNGIIMWCNEEGLLLQLPANFRMGYNIIVGNVFFTRSDKEGEIASLNNSDIQALQQLFG